MNFDFTEEQTAFKEMARSFARDELEPNAALWDKESFFPIETLKKAAALGFGGIYASEEIGGSNLTRLDAAVIFSELSQGCISTSAYLSIHNMVISIVDKYGRESLKKSYGPKLCAMDLLSSYCLTEPQAGSDAASLKTTATEKDGQYCLNGAKAFISGGGVSDVYIVMARTGDQTHRGISCFLVDKNTKGLSFGKNEEKLGWHSQPTSMVFFEDVLIPKDHLIGELGQGFKIALNALNGGRINIAACSLGGALKSLQLAKQYMYERKQFKSALSEFQALRFRLADMATECEAAKLLMYQAAVSLDSGCENTPTHCAMAKRYTTDVAFKVADEVLQLYGGYGYLSEYPIERIFRDLRVHRILEGTNEIMREIIAKNIFSDHFELTQ